MNYSKTYNSIIQKAQNSKRKKYKGVYFEDHHIIPECMGGLKDPKNMILLTAKEHFVCHHLLTKIYPNNSELRFAFWSMCNQYGSHQKRDYKITSIVYQNAKKAFAIENSKIHKGKKMSKEHIERSSKQWTENNPHKGKFGPNNSNSISYEIGYINGEKKTITGLQHFANSNNYNRRSLYKLMNQTIEYHRDLNYVRKIT